MIDAIDALPVVIQNPDGNPATIRLGGLCCACVARPADGDDDLCAKCRADRERWESEKREEK